LVGQHLSLRYYRRRGALWNEAAPGVLIGARPTQAEARALIRNGVSAVLDLTAEFSETPAFRCVDYLSLPTLDLTAPSPDQLDQAVRFIDRHSDEGTIYVHCKAGYSRSAAAVGAWLVDAGRAATAEEAMAILRRARPTITLRPEVQEALRGVEERRRRSLRRPEQAQAQAGV
ncbi:MAG TPA: dual specificity protein phosphatase family protein, partial [Planctomycetota bacterium]|nr:dual specificity protein phosphatase family protein [Planctomycetota bacterium]